MNRGVRELIPDIGIIPEVILLKLFLDLVPSSSLDKATCVVYIFSWMMNACPHGISKTGRDLKIAWGTTSGIRRI